MLDPIKRVLLTACLFGLTLANSAGEPPEYACHRDAPSLQWGCYKWTNQEDTQSGCADTGNKAVIMEWVAARRPNDAYSVVVDKDNDGTYTPGKYVPIAVKVLKADYKFRGMMLNAEDGEGNVVGEWDIPAEDSPMAWTSPTCPTTVTHKNAELKPYNQRFSFKAPAAGAGPITFKLLLKTGPANTGEFWVPLKDLVLQENNGGNGNQDWFAISDGKTCNETCVSMGRTGCDAAKLNDASTSSAFEAAVAVEIVCRRPVLAACAAPSFESADGFCFYNKEGCAPVSCVSSLPAGQTRMCACDALPSTTAPTVAPGTPTNDPTNAPTNAPTAPTAPTSPTAPTAPTATPTATPTSADTTLDTAASAAGRSGWSPIATMSLFLASVFGFGNEKVASSVLMMLLLVQLPSTQAHNWVMSPSRKQGNAMATSTCTSRTGTHFRVGPNQTFPFAISSGHFRTGRYVIVKGSDEDKLRDGAMGDMVDDYLANAPSLLTGDKYERYFGFITTTKHEAVSLLGDVVTNDLFTSFKSNGLRNTNPPSRVNRIDPNVLSNDKRAGYASDKYPWMVGAGSYYQKNWIHDPINAFLWEMEIPGYTSTGDYVLYWFWNGYSDCVDVNYVGSVVTNTSPEEMDTFSYYRVDHCRYRAPERVLTPCVRAVQNGNACVQALPELGQKNDNVLYGVQISDVNPSSAAFPQNTAIPYDSPTCVSGSDYKLAQAYFSESSVDVEAWMGSAQAGQRCTNTKQRLGNKHTTLKSAALVCSSNEQCVGIFWEDGAGTYGLCEEAATEADPAFTTLLMPDFAAGIDALTGDTITHSFGPGDSAVFDGTKGFTCLNSIPAANTDPEKVTGLSLEFVAGATDTESHVNRIGHRCYDEAPADARASYLPADTYQRWEHAVPNGVYSVTVNYFSATGYDMGGCLFEGVQLGGGLGVGGEGTTVTGEVEVLDGRLTVSGWTIPMQEGALDKCNYLARISFEPVKKSFPPVWWPLQKDPWAQVELAERAPVGLVTIDLNVLRILDTAVEDLCSTKLFFLAGNSCPIGAVDGFLRAGGRTFKGATMGVSDTPCSGSSCQGTLCTEVPSADPDRFYDHPGFKGARTVPAPGDKVSMYCHGAEGKYVWIQLPGAERVLNIDAAKIDIRRGRAPWTGSVCYGLIADASDERYSQYEETSDPDDTRFYSTCYRRERDNDFAVPPNEVIPPYRFNGACITCDNWQANKALEPWTKTKDALVINWERGTHCAQCV